MQDNFAVTMELDQGYAFDIDFELAGVPTLHTDEPAPLGEGSGPNPARLLAAAVGNCMSASLKFCLTRAHIEVHAMTTRVEGTMVRNERGRLRIGSMHILLEPVVAADDIERMGRCMEMFEDFCIVGQSVRQGIPMEVEVVPRPAVLAQGARTAEHMALSRG